LVSLEFFIDIRSF